MKRDTHDFPLVDLSSRHVEVYALAGGEKAVEGCAPLIGNKYVPRRGYRGPEFTSTISRAVYRMVAVRRYTSSCRPQTNGMVETLNRTFWKMLSYLVADGQNYYDCMLMHAVAAHSNSVSRGMGLAPNEVHISGYPRRPMTILEERGATGKQGLKADQLQCLQPMKERRVNAYELVRDEDRITAPKKRGSQ